MENRNAFYSFKSCFGLLTPLKIKLTACSEKYWRNKVWFSHGHGPQIDESIQNQSQSLFIILNWIDYFNHWYECLILPVCRFFSQIPFQCKRNREKKATMAFVIPNWIRHFINHKGVWFYQFDDFSLLNSIQM